MWNRIEEILEGFRKEFSHKAAYGWLIVLVIGIMVRTDTPGVTSVVRDLALRPECCESMMRFFRAGSWSLPALQTAWLGIVARHAPLWRSQGRVVLIGDGTKQSKEGRKMPGVKRLKQESETQSKASYIYGHLWGCVRILIGTAEKLACLPLCLPLCLRLHDVLRETADWKEPERPMSRGWFPRPAVAPLRLAPRFSCWTGSAPLWILFEFSTPITPRIPVGRTSFRE